MVLNFCVATQMLVRKAFCYNHETVVYSTCVYLHFVKPIKCHIHYADSWCLFYTR
jgi:hypothetical protein